MINFHTFFHSDLSHINTLVHTFSNFCAQFLFSHIFTYFLIFTHFHSFSPFLFSHTCIHFKFHISTCSCFGRIYTKIGTIQKRLAWPLCKDDTQNREVFHIFEHYAETKFETIETQSPAVCLKKISFSDGEYLLSTKIYY